MAVLDFTPAQTQSLASRVGTVLWDALMSYANARARTSEMKHYTDMSDAQLAELGMRREDIARYVFRDMLI